MANKVFTGGDSLKRKLKELSTQVDKANKLSAGFFEGSTENKSGQPIPLVALLDEYGTKNMPSRPFFRRMIKMGEKHWGEDLAVLLKHYEYDSDKALGALGLRLEDELKQSIADRVYTPLAPRTVARKGNDQTLIDSGDMQNAVAYRVGD